MVDPSMILLADAIGHNGHYTIILFLKGVDVYIATINRIKMLSWDSLLLEKRKSG